MFTQGLKIHHKEEFHRFGAGPAGAHNGAQGVKWGGGLGLMSGGLLHR